MTRWRNLLRNRLRGGAPEKARGAIPHDHARLLPLYRHRPQSWCPFGSETWQMEVNGNYQALLPNGHAEPPEVERAPLSETLIKSPRSRALPAPFAI